MTNTTLAHSDWLSTGCLYETNSEHIDIWYVDLGSADLDNVRPTTNKLKAEDLQHFETLSQDEQERANKLLIPKLRSQFIRTRAALRNILSLCLKKTGTQCAPQEIEFSYNLKGKPQLEYPSASKLQFNISHSEDIALIAVSKCSPIGIDISFNQRPTNWQGIAKRNFTVYEQTRLHEIKSENQLNAFHHLWCQKEAYTKAIGLGFAYGFKHFSVQLDKEQTMDIVVDDKIPNAMNNWHIDEVHLSTVTNVAIAYEATTTIKQRHWQYPQSD